MSQSTPAVTQNDADMPSLASLASLASLVSLAYSPSPLYLLSLVQFVLWHHCPLSVSVFNYVASLQPVFHLALLFLCSHFTPVLSLDRYRKGLQNH